MSRIEPSTVHHIAALARLRFEPADEARFAEELGRIVGYVDVLEQLSDDGAAGDLPDAPPTVLRPDRATNPPRPEELLAGAPDRDGDHLLVPAILASEG